MNNLGAITLLLLATLGQTFAGPAAGWSTNLADALAEAKASQRPVLAFFTASWCPPCRMMLGTTLTNEEVKQALASVHPVAVDIDEHADLARQYEISAVPTFTMLLSSGDSVAATTGYQAAGPFVDWITNSAVAAREAVLHGERCRQALAEVDAILAGSTAGGLTNAADRLLDLCVERETAVAQAAIARLSGLAREHPAILLEGLNRPRLAVRIHAANALRSALGSEFQIDPWSDATIRREAIDRWRARLSGPASRGD